MNKIIASAGTQPLWFSSGASKSMNDAAFQKMLQLAKAGDEAGADCLFTACYQSLRPFVENLMDPIFKRAKIEPEDIIQETYAAAWPRIATTPFDSFSAFLRWLRIVAENKAIDIRRGLLADKRDVYRQVNENCNSNTSYINLVDRLTAPKSTPSTTAARHEAVAILVGQMWRLPEDYRRVIQWRIIQGLPVAEVARQMDRSENAVNMLFVRALKKLRVLMGSPSKYLTHLY